MCISDEVYLSGFRSKCLHCNQFALLGEGPPCVPIKTGHWLAFHEWWKINRNEMLNMIHYSGDDEGAIKDAFFAGWFARSNDE